MTNSTSYYTNKSRSWIKSHLPMYLLAFTFFVSSCSKDDEPSVTVTVDGPNDVIIGINNELQLTAEVNGEPATSGLTWKSSNDLIAEVDDQGLVTARRHGVITITASDGFGEGEFTLQIFNISGDGDIEFDERVVDFMRQFTIPGAAFAVVKDQKLVMARGYGIGDILTSTVVVPNSLFRIADVSKPITAAAILKLVDDGLLNLNERMQTILDDIIPFTNLSDQRIPAITVGQLLNHSSGINLPQDPMFNQADVAVIQGVPSPPSLEDIFAWWTDQDLATDPGVAFTYQNINYSLLGRVIEAKSGLSYEEYVKRNILDPIEVTAPRIGLSHESDKFPREVSYYSPFTSDVLSVFDTDGGFVPFPYGGIGDIQNIDAHGGWIASVVDLARFALATDGNEATPDIISAESQELMVTEAGGGLGAGWFIGDDHWVHSGAMPGTMATLRVNDDGTVFIGMINSTHDFQGPFIQSMFEFFRNELRVIARDIDWPDEDLFDKY